MSDKNQKKALKIVKAFNSVSQCCLDGIVLITAKAFAKAELAQKLNQATFNCFASEWA